MNLTTDNRLVLLQQWIAQQFDLPEVKLQVVSGDASFRRYFRFYLPEDHIYHSLIAVDAPPDKENSQLFIDISQAYSDEGISVPEVFHADLKLGFMCQTDLGDRLLLPALNQRTVDSYYKRALSILPDIAAVTRTDNGKLPLFDETLLRNEMALFTNWLLPKHLHLQPTAEQQVILNDAFDRLVDNALGQPQVGVHRDYHSRNLLVDDNLRLSVIDFQDGVIGPVTYDAVSLLRDCYIQWPDELVYRHLFDFKQVIGQRVPAVSEADDATFIRWFDLMGMQRHVKICGIFARLYYRDNKPSYLADIPVSLNYLINVGKKYREFGPFVEFLTEQVKPLLLKKVS